MQFRVLPAPTRYIVTAHLRFVNSRLGGFSCALSSRLKHTARCYNVLRFRELVRFRVCNKVQERSDLRESCNGLNEEITSSSLFSFSRLRKNPTRPDRARMCRRNDER